MNAILPMPAITAVRQKEVVLYGTMHSDRFISLCGRLSCIRGLAFNMTSIDQEMLLEDPSRGGVSVNMRKESTTLINSVWKIRYADPPIPDDECPAIVRVSRSYLGITIPDDYSMIFLVTGLGLQFKSRLFSECYVFTRNRVKVIIERQRSCDSATGFQPFSNLYLVTMIAFLDEDEEHLPVARELRTLANELEPIVIMGKTDYGCRIVADADQV
uniref:Mediator of RNA polymerase II transcription subunit 18 n=1 Tax=Steinernema glaseri TaxID=37863 RepID=A0A1I7Y1C4_9BILA